MKPLPLFAVWLVLAAAPLVACSQAKLPRFSDYPAGARYTGPRVPPRLLPGTEAWYFRTRIREAARQAPNFAGHYILARWGCGAECLSSAIIDVKTGAVYFTDFTNCCWYSLATHEAGLAGTDPVEVAEPIAFRLNSRLVVFEGLLNEQGRKGPHCFTFAHGKLTALR